MKQYASEEMVRNALGNDGFDELAQPPNAVVPHSHPLWPKIEAAIREVFDPEIPVNVYELGLIYKVEIVDNAGGGSDVSVKMTLTSPACPVAQEMPGMVQSAIFPVDGVGDVDVEIIWEPTWDPSMMAETAKLQLNMFT
jgi:FeS assembly SUF system protein